MSETAYSQPIPPPLRQCGRCRLFFPTSGDLHPAELKQFWLCGDCASRLTPSRAPRPADDVPAQSDDSP